MKTSIMSIPQCAASHTLKSLSDNNINCLYMGVDQSGRILMQITFEQSKNEFIEELTSGMQEYERAINLIIQTVNTALEEAYQKYAAPVIFRKRRKYTPTETVTNGNNKN